MLLMELSTSDPCLSQPNLFWVLVGVVVHAAEWSAWAMYVESVQGGGARATLRRVWVPSFSWMSLATQEPGVVTPIAVRKNARVPEPVCGRCGLMLGHVVWVQL